MGAPIELPRPFLYWYLVSEINLHLQGFLQHSLTPTCELPIVTPVSGLPCQWSAQPLTTVLPAAFMLFHEELVQISSLPLIQLEIFPADVGPAETQAS